MSESPTKKRRTFGPSIVLTQTPPHTLPQSQLLSLTQPVSKATSRQRKRMGTWPTDAIPVEIFSIIISFLARSDIQNMRLVNREFEQKISEELFRTVVVPFKPEIYGIASELSRDVQIANGERGAVLLQDKGMRVFQGFGRHIHRFAMSFEIDYATLAEPPTKSDQEAITTFWGIYRWPFRKYNRYSQLEGLEQTADETLTMAKAFRFIGNATELGLSLDGGLGWLAGPDTNQKVEEAKKTVKVFGDPKFPNKIEDNITESTKKVVQLNTESDNRLLRAVGAWTTSRRESQNYSTIEQMLQEAGYKGEQLSSSIKTLMESEGYLKDVFSNDSFCPNTNSADDISEVFGLSNLIHVDRVQTETPTLQIQPTNNRMPRITSRNDHSDHSEAKSHYPLKPNNLSNAQKEMLLETEWAQRALMQSYTIAIIDNPISFRNVKTLTIARLPSRHIAILRREDFWSSLAQLEIVSLGVIPEWRDVVKLPTSWVEDVRVPPSQSIRSVYQLLKDHIASKRSIKKLNFEWLCGGEGAVGIFARNQNILAAPLLPQPMDMVTRNIHSPPILNLPYIEHLTLKNCWMSPHILLQFVKTLKQQPLKSLSLNSVSLSAPTAVNEPPGPTHNQNLAAQQAQPAQFGITVPVHFQGNQNFAMMQPAVPNANANATQNLNAVTPHSVPPLQQSPNLVDWLQNPRFGSWPHIIDSITPGMTLAALRHTEETGIPAPIPECSSLNTINFESCGYIRLHLDLDQSMLEPPGIQPGESPTIAKRRNELEGFMMKPLEHTLGTIIEYIDHAEVQTLERVFHLSMGWGPAGTDLELQAVADGIRNPGQGRFRGMVFNDFARSR